MQTAAPEACPARPEEFEALNERTSRAFEMRPEERLTLLEKLRRAYYRYSAEDPPRIQPVFTCVDRNSGRPIFTSDPSGCTYH
jgi:hypothetical protein